jgi:hypothetical protein
MTMRHKIGTAFVAGLILFVGLLGPRAASPAPEVTLSFDHFYDNAAIHKALQDLQAAYPQFLTVQSIGKSVQGRDIWAALLNNPKTGPAEKKPGYYIDGNIHGNEIQGGEVSLYAVYYLLKNYGRTTFATNLLDRVAFYVVPTMNPDSRDFYIHQAADPDSPRTGWVPYDDDRDGLKDEDPAEDLDGDGSITQMRKRDPRGMMKTSPDDPRLMVPVKPGEKGEWIVLGEEGIDNDGDGQINEDGPGGYDMNRNYGYNWQPNYVQGGAGDYPFCWPETKAVRDFILAHPNILGAQNFHNFGGMILRGPGASNLGEYNSQDIRVYDEIGKRGQKILPGYRYIIINKDMYSVFGGSVDFLYSTLGIFTFSNELDTDPIAEMSPKKEGAEEGGVMAMLSRSADQDEMIYHDNVLMGEQYTVWKPAKHPFYGDIEIGGVRKFGQRVPPLFKLAETCHRNAAFCLYHADQLPIIAFEGVTVKKLDGGLYQVDLLLFNSQSSPTMTAQAAGRKLHRPDVVRVEGKNATLLAVGQMQDRYRDLTRPVKTIKNAFDVDSGLPAHGRLDYRLIVQASGPITLTYDSLKGGTASKTVKLD